MNTKSFTIISLILFFLPVLLGGFEFMPKALWSYRNSFYAIIILFLVYIKNKTFRDNIKNLITNPDTAITDQRSTFLINILKVIYFFIFLKLVIINFYTFHVVDVDFSYFDWMIANFVKGKGWFSPACNCNHFGVHSTYIFYILAPFHSLIGHPLFLVCLHAVVLWSSIFPLVKIMNFKKLAPVHKVLFAFGFLNLSAISHILKYNFHMEVFFVPFFLWLFYFLETRKWIWFYIFALLILSVKEDAGFYLIGVSAAIFLFHKKTKRHAILLGLLAITVTIISLKLVIPHFRDSADFIIAGTASKYGNNIKEILINLLMQPHLLIKEIVNGHWIRLLIPCLFTPLLVPFFVISAAPFIVIHSISGSTLMHSLMLYYSAPYIPFIIYSLILFLSGKYLFKNKLNFSQKHMSYFLIFFILYGSLVGSGYLTFSPIKSDASNFNKIASVIRKNSQVCAQGSIMPHFTYDYDLWPIPHCIDKGFEYIIFNPKINTYPYNNIQIAQFIQRFSDNKNYSKTIFGNFLLFKKIK